MNESEATAAVVGRSFIFTLGQYSSFTSFTEVEKYILMSFYLILSLASILFNTPFIYVLIFKKKFHTNSYLIYLSLFCFSYLINVVAIMKIIQLPCDRFEMDVTFQTIMNYFLIVYFIGTCDSLCMISIYRAQATHLRFTASTKKIVIFIIIIFVVALTAPLTVAAVISRLNLIALGVTTIILMVSFFGVLHFTYFYIYTKMKKSTARLQRMKSESSRKTVDTHRKRRIQRLNRSIHRIMNTFLLSNFMMVVRAGFFIQQSLDPTYFENNLRVMSSIDASAEILALFGTVLHPLIYVNRDNDLFLAVVRLPILKHFRKRPKMFANVYTVNTKTSANSKSTAYVRRLSIVVRNPNNVESTP